MVKRAGAPFMDNNETTRGRSNYKCKGILMCEIHDGRVLQTFTCVIATCEFSTTGGRQDGGTYEQEDNKTEIKCLGNANRRY